MVSNITNYIRSLNFKYRSNLMSDDVKWVWRPSFTVATSTARVPS